MPEEHPVDIKLKYFLLGQRPFNLQCQQNFIEFPEEGSLQGQEVISRHLHGQGAAPGAFLASHHQLGYGSGETQGIDAAVLEKLIVLGSQQGIDEICRDFLKGQGASLLLAELAD